MLDNINITIKRDVFVLINTIFRLYPELICQFNFLQIFFNFSTHNDTVCFLIYFLLMVDRS